MFEGRVQVEEKEWSRFRGAELANSLWAMGQVDSGVVHATF
jgi:hypothetical protein